jgi:hypothetical protein
VSHVTADSAEEQEQVARRDALRKDIGDASVERDEAPLLLLVARLCGVNTHSRLVLFVLQ